MTPERCSDLSLAAGEPLHATAPTATRWLAIEVHGTWPRDVSAEGALPPAAREAVGDWLARASGRKLLFVRRPGRGRGRLAAFVVRSEEHDSEVRRLELGDYGELASADLETDGERVARALVLVCGHGTRDACCALRGTALFAALEPELDEEAVWLSSHHGGHRFAANVLVLPSGLHFGRVEPEESVALVRGALVGSIALGRYRGRVCFEPAVQAAEIALRLELGVATLDELRFLSRDGDVVRFRDGAGAEHAARVEERDGPSIPASCGAEPEVQRVLRAHALRDGDQRRSR